MIKRDDISSNLKVSTPCEYSELLNEVDSNGCLRRHRDIIIYLKKEKFDSLPLVLQNKFNNNLNTAAASTDSNEIPVEHRDNDLNSRYEQSRTELEAYMEDVKADMDDIKEIVSREIKEKALREQLKKSLEKETHPKD